MRTTDFDFHLPPRLIAQEPAPRRDDSRLLVLDRASRSIRHSRFHRLTDHLRTGDVLVLNDSRVIPARLRGHKTSGGEIEILLLEPAGENRWTVMLRPGKRVREGTPLLFGTDANLLHAEVEVRHPDGLFDLRFHGDPLAFAMRHGEMPLPPYISRDRPRGADRERYQTVYAEEPGSVAAPTAGLHFTEDLLGRIRSMGVETCSVTLHVGIGTFAPVKAERLEDHVMHEERYVVGPQTVTTLERARAEGRRIIAVGTTSLRVLESVARAHEGRLAAGPGRTRLFLHPPAEFRVVNALLTNFHLPRSTLLMLVCAFASPGRTEGREWMLEAYREAVEREYRFFSYGDAMFIQ